MVPFREASALRGEKPCSVKSEIGSITALPGRAAAEQACAVSDDGDTDVSGGRATERADSAN